MFVFICIFVNKPDVVCDDSDEVPNLKDKQYSDFCLLKKDWDTLKLMHEVLQVFIQCALKLNYLFSLF
jgi:hypothetical protein